MKPEWYHTQFITLLLWTFWWLLSSECSFCHFEFNSNFNFDKVINVIRFHSLIIFPQAGPDVKYFLGFVRTQLSTTTTVVLVFGPKVLRVLRGQGDQWDHRARVRGITASFSLNGIGLVPEDSPDLYQENEELKVCFFFFNYITNSLHYGHIQSN